MATLDLKVLPVANTPGEASTDMGNVSQYVPSFHGIFAIPTPPGVGPHNEKFATAAGTDEAHAAAINAAKGMAILAVRLLADEELANRARREFDELGGLHGEKA
jgi:metal-dependent amidase/aminoacylase/carboxypeptidase family protein